MKCPVDNNELKIINREGVGINYCPECNGVWMSRNDLDKIIEQCYVEFENVRKPDYPDLKEPSHREEQRKYKGPGDSYFGRLFDIHKM
jgi:Zn-finger nucleic acid-binding protein